MSEEFIKKANIRHNNKYDYSLVKYINSKTLIQIICLNHGSFFQNPSNHLQGNGCSKCSGKYKWTTNEWILESKKIHGDLYDYSKVEYKSAFKNIIIICKIHGEFLQTPHNHRTNKSGCLKCGGRYNYTTEEWIIEAIKIHENKYDYSKTNYINNRSDIIIICHVNEYGVEHGEFFQNPSGHLSGFGCSKCGGCFKYNTDNWIQKAKALYKDKYDYSKVIYTGHHNHIIIICKTHGEWSQAPSGHFSGHGCPKCAKNYQYTTEEWILEAKKIHKDEYDYSKSIYTKSHNNICIICHKKDNNNIEHGEFYRSSSAHLTGAKCNKCLSCPSCGIWRTLSGNLCEYCKPVNINILYQKTKEMDVVKFLKQNCNEIFIHNKSVGSDCSDGHLFPDIRFDFSYYNLIIEIDEHKHRGSSYNCDLQRMYDIVAKLGQPCVFIRYNPDSKLSNKQTLLLLINKYISSNENIIKNDDLNNNIKFDDFGLKIEYLFY